MIPNPLTYVLTTRSTVWAEVFGGLNAAIAGGTAILWYSTGAVIVSAVVVLLLLL